MRKKILLGIFIGGLISLLSNKVCLAAVINVSTADELIAIKTTSSQRYAGDTINILNDIDLTGKTFTPIGSPSYPFAGTFEGNNHTISGLSLSTSTTYRGLFGKTASTAVIQNLTVSGSVKGTNYTGGVVGYNLGKIENVTSNVTVSASTSSYNYYGGIAGYSAGQGIINCTNNGTITGGKYVGGIIGSASRETISNATNSGIVTTPYGDYSWDEDEVYVYNLCVGGIVGDLNNATITNSKNLANVSGTHANFAQGVGGMVGVASNSSITDSYNTGDVSTSYYYLGGIVGRTSGAITIHNVYNTGKVTGKSCFVGGIVGDMYYAYGSLLNVYNTGAVTGNTGKATYIIRSYIGGLTGSISTSGKDVSIKNSYNAGNVVNTGTAAYKGAIAGYRNGTTNIIENTYYLSGTAEKGVYSGTDNTIVKTSAELATNEMKDLLNADQNPIVWYRTDGLNNGYPILSSELIKMESITITSEPLDAKIREESGATFVVAATGTDPEYQWYEVKNGVTTKLDPYLKSNIEGKNSTTATQTIIVNTANPGTLSFDYFTSTELGKDLFNATVTDNNGTRSLVTNASGVSADWVTVSEQVIPASGKVTLTFTYAKDASGNGNRDYCAIKNVRFLPQLASSSSYETAGAYTFSGEWVKDTEDGETIYRSNNKGNASSTSSATIQVRVGAGKNASIKFDYRVSSEASYDKLTITVKDANTTQTVANAISGDGSWISHSGTYTGDANGLVTISLSYSKDGSADKFKDIGAIKNLSADVGGEEIVSSLQSDANFTLTNTLWSPVYLGVNTAQLTIPGAAITDDLIGNRYYCVVSNAISEKTTRQALLQKIYEFSKIQFSIDPQKTIDGKKYTKTKSVTVHIVSPSDAIEGSVQMALVNENEIATKKNSSIVWENITSTNMTKTWSLSNGDGDKRVYLLLKDKYGNQSMYLSD